MPKPSFSWKVGLAALLLGVCFAAANIYLGHGALANLCFGLAVLCDLVVVVFAILWVYGQGWYATPQQQQMQGKPPMQGMPQMPQMKGTPQMQIRPMQAPQAPGAAPAAAPQTTTGAAPNQTPRPPAR